MNDKEYGKYLKDMENIKKLPEDKMFDRCLEIYGSIEPPTKLYRYRKFNAYTLDEIIQSRIYMSKFSQFNDKFEARIIWSEYMSEETPKQAAARLRERISEHKPQNANERIIVDMVRDDKEKFDRSFDEGFGIASFNETYTSNPMWAHYADEYKGVCIEYDEDSIFKAERTYLMPVVYSKHLENYYVGKTNVEAYTFVTGLLKHEDWSYEKEWRLVKLLTSPKTIDEERYTYNAKINAIYFGVDMPERDKKVIKQYVGDSIKLYNMEITYMGLKPIEYK